MPLDYPSSMTGKISGMVVIGFIPFSFKQGGKTFWCEEGQCIIRLTQGRFDALGLSVHDEISVANANIDTSMQTGSYHWTITVSDYPETVVGVHATKKDLKRTIDLFAGLTNWSQVATKLGLTSLVSIDNCEEVANVGAKNLKVSKWGANEFTEHWTHDFGRTYKDCPVMVVADVRNQYIREPISCFRCGLMLGSPPCQPWSWLSSRMGLSDDRGKLFLSVADLGEFLGCHIIDLENVSGLTQHADWESVVAHFREHGYSLIYHGIDSLQGYLPVNRSRANVIFARVDFHHVNIPSSMKLSECIWGDLSAKSFGDVHKQHNLSDPTLQALTNIDDTDLNILMEPNYFTKDVADRVRAGASPLAARSKGSKGPLPCPTARYGSPQLLSEKTLYENKLTMVIHRDGDSFRWFSPFEFMMGLGLPVWTMLPIDRQIAFLAVGNTIAPLHVALNINRALFCMGDDQRKVKAISSIVQQFADRQIPIHMCDVHHDCEVMWLAPKNDPLSKVGPPNVEMYDVDNGNKRKHDVVDSLGGDNTSQKKAKSDQTHQNINAVILNQQCDEMAVRGLDERILLKDFIQTVQHDCFFMLFCESKVGQKNLKQIRDIVASAKTHANDVMAQFEAMNDPLTPTVHKTEASDFVSCWIQRPNGFNHRECSVQASFCELEAIVEHPITIIVFPGPKPQVHSPVTCPVEHVKALWIRGGQMGELHQVWVRPDETIGNLLLRYQVPGFICDFLVNGRRKHHDETVREIQDVVEIRQCAIVPPRVPLRYNDILDDVQITNEDRTFLRDPFNCFALPRPERSTGSVGT